MALERADRVSEAFEVLAALVESEMSLLLANCQVAGIGLTAGGARPSRDDPQTNKDWSTLWKRATERRRSAETLARRLLARHDRDKDYWEDSGRHTRYRSFLSLFLTYLLSYFLFFLLLSFLLSFLSSTG